MNFVDFYFIPSKVGFTKKFSFAPICTCFLWIIDAHKHTLRKFLLHTCGNWWELLLFPRFINCKLGFLWDMERLIRIKTFNNKKISLSSIWFRQIMDYGNPKNCQTAKMAVFVRFLCGFCAVFVRILSIFNFKMINLRHLRIVFCCFGNFYPPNMLINRKIMAYGILKNRQTANMAVFWRFL